MLRASLTETILAGTVTILSLMPQPAAAFTVTVEPLPTLTFPEKRTPKSADARQDAPARTASPAR